MVDSTLRLEENGAKEQYMEAFIHHLVSGALEEQLDIRLLPENG